MNILTLPVGGNLLLNLLTGFSCSYGYNTTVPNVFLAPPKILFPIVWTALYVLLAIVSGNLDTDLMSFLYYTQLALNFLWPTVYFGMKIPSLALVIIIAMLVITIILITMSSKLYPYLMPYIVWLAYASYLNASSLT